MGFLTRLFGQEGTIRFEGETTDGQTFNGKTSFEAFNIDNNEAEAYLKNFLWVEKGLRVKWVKITGFLPN